MRLFKTLAGMCLLLLASTMVGCETTQRADNSIQLIKTGFSSQEVLTMLGEPDRKFDETFVDNQTNTRWTAEVWRYGNKDVIFWKPRQDLVEGWLMVNNVERAN